MEVKSYRQRTKEAESKVAELEQELATARILIDRGAERAQKRIKQIWTLTGELEAVQAEIGSALGALPDYPLSAMVCLNRTLTPPQSSPSGQTQG